MKRLLAAAGLSAALVITGCDRGDEDSPAAPDAADTAVEPASSAAREAPAPDDGGMAEATAAAPGAPPFAVLYPGATTKGEALAAQSPAGPGGMVEFLTEASPDAVVEFYRQRAEGAGLMSITTLSRDGARGYAAGDGADGSGRMLNVVATPMEDGATDVMLSWSSGR